MAEEDSMQEQMAMSAQRWKSKKNQKEVSEVKNTVAETKNASDGLIRRLDIAEERFSDLEDVSIEMAKTERLKKNRTEQTVEQLQKV